MSDSISQTRSGPAVAVTDPLPWTVAAGIVGLITWVFWDFLSAQVRIAIEKQADWGHTLVIPLISGYFVYLNRQRLAAIRFRTTWSALLPVIAGTAVYMLATFGPEGIRHHNLQGLGLAIVLFGVTLLFFGWRAMAILWFPLAYLVIFGQTVSQRLMDIVTYQLQDIAARGSYFALMLIGVDVSRDGNVLTVFSDGEAKPLNIAEACSGMRMVMAFLALAVAMGYTGFRRLWQRVTLVIMAIPTAIFVNILRVVTLALLSLVDAGLAAGDFHSFVGLVWLVPAFLIFLGIMWIIRHVVIEPETPAEAQRDPAHDFVLHFDGRSRVAVVVLGVLFVVFGAGAVYAVNGLNIYLRKEPVQLRQPFVNISPTLGRWKSLGDTVLDKETVETLGTDVYFDRNYAIDGDPRNGSISVHVAYYTGMLDAVPHIPDRCFVANGLDKASATRTLPLEVRQADWNRESGLVNNATDEVYPSYTYYHRITGTPIRVLMPIGDFELRVTEFSVPDRPGARVFAGFTFVTNGRTTGEPTNIRWMAFDKRDKYAYYAKVQFTMVGGEELDADEFLARVGEIYSELLPELMRCLPDWHEVERRTAGHAVEETGS